MAAAGWLVESVWQFLEDLVLGSCPVGDAGDRVTVDLPMLFVFHQVVVDAQAAQVGGLSLVDG